jgi:hypothetical protein
VVGWHKGAGPKGLGTRGWAEGAGPKGQGSGEGWRITAELCRGRAGAGGLEPGLARGTIRAQYPGSTPFVPLSRINIISFGDLELGLKLKILVFIWKKISFLFMRQVTMSSPFGF